MDIGKRIKERRKELGLSAEEVAARMGVSPATVYRYESNYISNMGIDKVTPIAKALHTSEAYLLGWVDNPSQSISIVSEHQSAPSKNSFEKRILTYCALLNGLGKQRAIEFIQDLASVKKYTDNIDSASCAEDFTLTLAAHERTDTEASEEDRKHDLDIMNSDDF